MNKTDLDLETLRTLVAIVDTGSFTRAAAILHKTQAAVSAAIAGLERTAGQRLLARSRRGTWPTPAGEVLVGYARRVLGLLGEAAATLEGTRPGGILRLGVPDECLGAIVTPVVEQLAQTCPTVLIDIRCALSATLEAALWAGELDAAVIVREPGSGRGELLFCDPLVWCVPPGHDPQRLRPLPVALFAEGCRTRSLVIAALGAAGISYREAIRASHIAGLVAMAGRGLAVVALAGRAVPPGWRMLDPRQEGLPSLPHYEACLLLPVRPSLLAGHVADLLRMAMGPESGAVREVGTPPPV